MTKSLTPRTRMLRAAAALACTSGLILVAGCQEGGAATSADGADPTASSTSVTPTDTGDPTAADPAEADSAFTQLEDDFDARVGVYAVDLDTGRELAWRGDERFAYASTIKAMASAALLDEVGTDGLSKRVSISEDDIVSHSPVTETKVGGTMTLAELCEAAMTQSDNGAANLIFAELGGPAALDERLNDLGDTGTTVSRTEPGLNEAKPGDPRDTTTPRASAGNLREYVFGGALEDDEATTLTDWMKATQTGDTLIRAELPEEWTVGDKSGTGYYGSRADLGIVWPGDGGPIIISVLSSKDEKDAEADDRLISGAAAIAVEQIR
ncbi:MULTISPECIES: class A beta-lactamase [Brevibacterium]|uniref:Beta-lactamase n=4 Tax=Bacteria TaxID=2 RepID=K9B0H7_9MICO|nr:class A beta-lactamase [Brevibacterium casei]SIG90121.1 beta-lactamase [Mycobacteroides abscessus subsp. abscessus]EKU48302.1 beta-lactamase [Brevibacterium casei S18]KZE21529.1 class A beta-lactamase [Brevibacterium casei]MCT1549776.1 class A beta-lactamase [Brevibacterium casei]MCT1559703.1 class A beta-lactamase [Brevibacterium casei]